jgi:hypothetical protein
MHTEVQYSPAFAAAKVRSGQGECITLRGGAPPEDPDH